MSNASPLNLIEQLNSMMSESPFIHNDETDGTHFTNEADLKMRQLVLDIYNEFEAILKIHGEQPLTNIVPLVANLLENLTEVSLQKDRLASELDTLKDHQTILIAKYEATKVDIKLFEEQIYTVEDELHEKIKQLDNLRLTSDSSKHLLNLKLRNATDQIYRLEEHGKEMLLTYSNLKQRYGELFRQHLEYLEKTRVSLSVPNAYTDDDEMYTYGESKPHPNASLSEEISASSLTTRNVGTALSVSRTSDSPYDWVGVRRKVMQSIYETTPELHVQPPESPFSKYMEDRFDDLSYCEEKSEPTEADISPKTPSQRDHSFDFNVSKEVTQLVKESNELEQTKNAFNVVIHDLLSQIEDVTSEKEKLNDSLSQLQLGRSSMQLHIANLEIEINRLKKELAKTEECENNESSSFSKRSRFTRDEIVTVLEERNKLKEELSELKEALSWEDVLNARRQAVALQPSESDSSSRYRKKGFLAFFSRLFGRQNKNLSSSSSLSVSFDFANGVRIIAPENENPETSGQTNLLLDASRLQQQTGNSKFSPSVQQSEAGKQSPGDSNIGWNPVPVEGEVCRPQPIVFRSTDKSVIGCQNNNLSTTQNNAHGSFPIPLYRRGLNEALADRMQVSSATFTFADEVDLLPSGSDATPVMSRYPPMAEHLSSEVWLCLMGVVSKAVSGVSNDAQSSMQPIEPQPVFRSQIVVVHANAPESYIDSFRLPHSVITCMKAIPRASVRDFDVLKYSNDVWDSMPSSSMKCTDDDKSNFDQSINSLLDDKHQSVRNSPFDQTLPSLTQGVQDWYRVAKQHFSQHICPSKTTYPSRCVDGGRSFEQTIWLGCQNGDIFVHSNKQPREQCLQTIRLPSGVTDIQHFMGRTFVSLVGGQVVVFRRHMPTVSTPPSMQHSEADPLTNVMPDISHWASQDMAVTSTQDHQSPSNNVSIDKEFKVLEAGVGSWDLSNACVITCGSSQHSVKCLVVVASALSLWAAYRNSVIVIDTTNFQKLTSFEVNSEKNSQIKCMSWIRDGVWISLRTEPIIRLYQAFSYQALQELNLENLINQTLIDQSLPPVSSLSSCASAIHTSDTQLWIGTRNGAILLTPFVNNTYNDATGNHLTENSINTLTSALGNRGANLQETNAFSQSSAMVNTKDVYISNFSHSESVNFFIPAALSGDLLLPDLLPDALPILHLNVKHCLLLSGGIGYRAIGSNTSTKEKNICHLLVWLDSQKSNPP